jgi:hypothetical protein
MRFIKKQKYDPAQMQQLADLVRIYRDKGQPFDYEIIVDGLKVVRRTNDPDMFFLFENFVVAETKAVEILFYVGSSNVNERRVFTFIDDDEEVSEKALDGVELKTMLEEGLEKQKKQIEHDLLVKEHQKLQAEVDELKKEIDNLERANDELINSQSPLKGFLGELGSSFVESFVRRNPNLLKGIPGGEALAGLIENDNKRKERESNTPDAEVSFQPKNNDNASSLCEEDQAAITFVNQLKSQFSKAEFDKILLILQTLSDDKSKIELILNHVNIKQPQL